MNKKMLFPFIATIFLLFTSQNVIAENNCDSWKQKNQLMSYWDLDSADGTIKKESCDNENCVKIYRSTKGRTFIRKKIKAPFDGKYGFKAVIKATDIVIGDKRYERGKFQVILLSQWGEDISSERNYYPNADFNNIPNWRTQVFTVKDVKKGEVMEVRIGLQEAKGTVFMSDFEYCYLGK